MSEQRDILLVCDTVAGPDDGRRELRRLAELFTGAGHRVRVIAVRAGGDRPEPPFETTKVEAVSNTETGLFRPVPLADGRLLVFRYTGRGFIPTWIEPRRP